MLDDDDYEFPPTAHPGREALTMGLAFIGLMAVGLWLWGLAWKALDVWG